MKMSERQMAGEAVKTKVRSSEVGKLCRVRGSDLRRSDLATLAVGSAVSG